MLENYYDKERIDRLRSDAIGEPITYDYYRMLFYRGMQQSKENRSYEDRYARALGFMFETAEPYIADGELIVGRLSPGEFTPELRSEWEQMRAVIDTGASPYGQESHMAIDYEMLLSQGINGIIRRIEGYIALLDPADCADIAKQTYYQSCIGCLKAVVRFSERYAEKAEALAKVEADEKRRCELLRIAEICRRVPANPAEGFYEAVQSVHFVTFALTAGKPLKPSCLQYQLGRPDRYFLPYYEADIATGKLTDYEAQTLLDCLGIMINHRVPRGLSSGYMVGGRDEKGQIVSNPLTKMLVKVVENNRLVFPAVGYCWSKNIPAEDMRLCCQTVGLGLSHPAFYNDEVITDGLARLGLPPALCCNYIHCTCVEITPVGHSNSWVASPYTNLAQKLVDVLTREYADFDELLAAYFSHLDESILDNFREQNRFRLERAKYSIDPLLSCFVHDCLETCTDIESGGARCNWIMPSFVGLSNLVDSLAVIRKFIFEQHLFGFEKLSEMLSCDFEGCECELEQINDFAAKYGNDDDSTDELAGIITRHIAEVCKSYRCFAGGRLVPSLFCWEMHDRFGRSMGASPDGRRKGFPLGDGSGPAQGRELKGPTASLLSSTKWEHTDFIGGIAVNLKFSKKLFSEQSMPKLQALISTYLKRGGFELQINVVDRETLLKAREHPEMYRDLVVRVGGYSDYFVNLSPSMQQEIIMRTEHEV